MSEQIEPARIATPLGRSLLNEGNGALNLIRDDPDIAGVVFHPGEVRDHKMGACPHKQFGRRAELGGAARPPSAAMDEDRDWCVATSAMKKVEGLNCTRSIRHAPRFAQPGTHLR